LGARNLERAPRSAAGTEARSLYRDRVIRRVVSGGQTGVDRAALDAARALGLSAGGWCPRGRHAEDGLIPVRYPLRETPSREYAQRTEWNVRDSDGTLVLTRGRASGGTAYTIEVARHLRRPLLVLDLARMPEAEALRVWSATHAVGTLNVAGPRESQRPGIHDQALAFLKAAFERAGEGGAGG
jgi:hypothetical protein